MKLCRVHRGPLPDESRHAKHVRFVRSNLQQRISESGYVALEFALGMGMLVLPTALILLQIPAALEQHDRVRALSSTVAHACASQADSLLEADQIARTTAQVEMSSSSILRNSSLANASCTYESTSIQPGSGVRANVSVAVPAPLLPFLPGDPTWTINESHDAIVPTYRSIEE